MNYNKNQSVRPHPRPPVRMMRVMRSHVTPGHE